MTYTTRPLSDRTWLRPALRRRSPFTAGWTDTLTMLEREIEFLRGRHIVIEVDVPERAIRLDGQLRADARPADPAVRVAFDTPKFGGLVYSCDAFDTRAYQSRTVHPWQDNVRAIAFKLEALRAVDRYSATGRGEQYTGFRALEAGTAMGPGGKPSITSKEAQARILAIAGADGGWPISAEGIARVVKAAKRAAHPDSNGGDLAEWGDLTEALTALHLP